MLFVLVCSLFCQLVRAEEPSALINEPPAPSVKTATAVPAPQYDRCQVEVLVNWDQHQEMAFRVTMLGEIDPQTATLLSLSAREIFSGVAVQLASPPFDSAFMELVFPNNERSVYGWLLAEDPEELHLLPGRLKDSQPVTLQGVTGLLYLIDARPACKS